MSVRSVSEANEAVAGGAAIVDIKDPARGPLGMAPVQVWREIRWVVPPRIRVSVALGELQEWDLSDDESGRMFAECPGISFRKIGLARSSPDWADRWASLRARSPGPPWVAVAYADWERAGAPGPHEVLDVALDVPDCVAVLIDTFSKAGDLRIDETWLPIVARVKAAGRKIALAGGRDARKIRQLAPLGPDIFAVRGSACRGGDRMEDVERDRVLSLARLAFTVRV